MTVLISVNKQSSASLSYGREGIHGVEAFAVGHCDERVFQRSRLLHAVYPLPHIRIFAEHPAVPLLHTTVIRVGLQRIVRYVQAATRQSRNNHHER